jgi:hypothetical protein
MKQNILPKRKPRKTFCPKENQAKFDFDWNLLQAVYIQIFSILKVLLTIHRLLL